jgi:uncharacterized lipoprotein YajG
MRLKGESLIVFSLNKSMKKLFVVLAFVFLSACGTGIQNTTVDVSETDTIIHT